jgi:hypothetical protein
MRRNPVVCTILTNQFWHGRYTKGMTPKGTEIQDMLRTPLLSDRASRMATYSTGNSQARLPYAFNPYHG